MRVRSVMQTWCYSPDWINQKREKNQRHQTRQKSLANGANWCVVVQSESRFRMNVCYLSHKDPVEKFEDALKTFSEFLIFVPQVQVIALSISTRKTESTLLKSGITVEQIRKESCALWDTREFICEVKPLSKVLFFYWAPPIHFKKLDKICII